MARQPAPATAHQYDVLPGDTMTNAAFAMWQETFAFGTAWWNAVIDACWPDRPFHHRQARHDPHHQLVVPEPIEDEGESALLA